MAGWLQGLLFIFVLQQLIYYPAEFNTWIVIRHAHEFPQSWICHLRLLKWMMSFTKHLITAINATRIWIDVALCSEEIPNVALRPSTLSSYTIWLVTLIIQHISCSICVFECALDPKMNVIVWGLKWNQCLRVLSYSFGKWLCDMLHFLFLFTETHVFCGSWQENTPRMAERTYWFDKLSCITTWGNVFKNMMRFLPGWAVKLFSGVIIKLAFCSGELKDVVTWGVIRRGRRHGWGRV